MKAPKGSEPELPPGVALDGNGDAFDVATGVYAERCEGCGCLIFPLDDPLCDECQQQNREQQSQRAK